MGFVCEFKLSEALPLSVWLGHYHTMSLCFDTAENCNCSISIPLVTLHTNGRAKITFLIFLVWHNHGWIYTGFESSPLKVPEVGFPPPFCYALNIIMLSSRPDSLLNQIGWSWVCSPALCKIQFTFSAADFNHWLLLKHEEMAIIMNIPFLMVTLETF